MIKTGFPDMNYFVRAGWVIALAFVVIAIPSIIQNGGIRPMKDYLKAASPKMKWWGVLLLLSLILLHIVFH